MQLSGTTTLLGLIGSPVAHSKSPAMYNYCFRKFHMDCAYLAFDVAADQVEQSVKGHPDPAHAGRQRDDAL